MTWARSVALPAAGWMNATKTRVHLRFNTYAPLRAGRPLGESTERALEKFSWRVHRNIRFGDSSDVAVQAARECRRAQNLAAIEARQAPPCPAMAPLFVMQGKPPEQVTVSPCGLPVRRPAYAQQSTTAAPLAAPKGHQNRTGEAPPKEIKVVAPLEITTNSIAMELRSLRSTALGKLLAMG